MRVDASVCSGLRHTCHDDQEVRPMTGGIGFLRHTPTAVCTLGVAPPASILTACRSSARGSLPISRTSDGGLFVSSIRLLPERRSSQVEGILESGSDVM